MHSLRKPKKRRTIKIDRNEEELAQDNLLEISYLADDKFEDESHVLSAEYHSFPAPLREPTNLHRDIKRIISNNRQPSHNRRAIDYATRYHENLKSEANANDQKELLLLNQLESNSVFVGNKTNIHSLRQHFNCLLIAKKKRLDTCPTVPSYNTQPHSPAKRLYTDCHQIPSRLMVGNSQAQPRHTSVGLIRTWKIRNKSKENMKELRAKMRNTLFFDTAHPS